MMPKTKTLFRSLDRVFRFSDNHEKEMRVQLARVCVLYGDLLLEFRGTDAERLDAIDRWGVGVRQHYFIRRTLGTLSEMEGAVNQLNLNRAFKLSKRGWKKENLAWWDAAVRFFAKHHEFLKAWRNDVGGHFLDDAAEYAIDNMPKARVGAIEMEFLDNGGIEVHYKFAHELMLLGLTKNKDKADEFMTFYQTSMDWLASAVGHAFKVSQVLGVELILE